VACAGAFAGSGHDGGTFVDAAERRAEGLVAGPAVSLVAHEGMNEAEKRKPRVGGGVGERGPATLRVPAEHLVGEAQRPHGVSAHGQLHASRRHLENVVPARCIEDIRPFKKTREALQSLQ